MKFAKKRNIAVTVVLCALFVFIPQVYAQTTIMSDNPLSIFKDFLPDPAKEIINIAGDAQKKLETRFGIDIQKMISTAGSSQKLTPDYTMNLLERVSGLISSTNPADTPGFIGQATDIVRQFIKYVIGIMRQIVDMI